jgi:hypothetical protein
MQLPIRNALLFSGIYILAELIIFMLRYNHIESIMMIRVVSASLLMLLAVAISILVNFKRNRAGGLSMLVDLKVGIASAAIFALITSLFLTFYFTTIDTEFAENRRAVFTEKIQDPEERAKLEIILKENNTNLSEGQTIDDLIEQNHENMTQMLSPKTVFPMAMFSLLLLGMIYAFGVTALNRIILSKL